jgi:SNF family Na+-dependent transporter
VTAPIARRAAAQQVYNSFTRTAQDGILFTGDSKLTILSWIIVFALNIFFVFRGLSKGIEKFCSYAMPAMAVLAVIVLLRVLTLGTPDPSIPEQNVVNGLGYMWNPDYSRLTDFQTWLAAAGQIFFSLSVGFGVIINYSSYMKRNDDVALSGLTASATNELFEVGFGGMITLTAAFVFLGLSGTTAAVATGSFSLGFATLPVVFAHMGALGNFVGAAGSSYVLAAITSSLSMYQPAVAHQVWAGLTARRREPCRLGTIGAILTLWFTQGSAFWSPDFWVGTYLIFIMGVSHLLRWCSAWIVGGRRFTALRSGSAYLQVHHEVRGAVSDHRVRRLR